MNHRHAPSAQARASGTIANEIEIYGKQIYLVQFATCRPIQPALHRKLVVLMKMPQSSHSRVKMNSYMGRQQLDGRTESRTDIQLKRLAVACMPMRLFPSWNKKIVYIQLYLHGSCTYLLMPWTPPFSCCLCRRHMEGVQPNLANASDC